MLLKILSQSRIVISYTYALLKSWKSRKHVNDTAL